LSVDNIFLLGLAFVEDMILSMKPDTLGLMFLLYDCQQFSESLVTKSINLIMKYSRGQTHKFKRLLANLFKVLARLDLPG